MIRAVFMKRSGLWFGETEIGVQTVDGLPRWREVFVLNKVCVLIARDPGYDIPSECVESMTQLQNGGRPLEAINPLTKPSSQIGQHWLKGGNALLGEERFKRLPSPSMQIMRHSCYVSIYNNVSFKSRFYSTSSSYLQGSSQPGIRCRHLFFGYSHSHRVPNSNPNPL